MRAIAVTPGQKQSVRLASLPVPEIGPNEVLLKVEEVGIDGTDIEINQGLYGEAPKEDDYLVIGHECLAAVERIGAGVSQFQPGNLVVPTVRRPDDCWNCQKGESDDCVKGEYAEHGIKELHGFASDYAKSDAGFLTKIPDELHDVAVLLEPLSVAEKAVRQSFKIQKRMCWDPHKALVLGTGSLGLLTTMLLKLRGLHVTAVGTATAGLKIDLIQKARSNYISVKNRPLHEWTEKFDLIIEATGNAQVAADALKLLDANGVLCFLGVYPPGESCAHFSDVLKDTVLQNKLFFGSVNANITYFKHGIEDMTLITHQLPGVLEAMITKRLSVDNYDRAFAPEREDIKTVVQFDPTEKI